MVNGATERLNEENARKALGVLRAVANVTTARVMPELVLLFNPLSSDSYAPPCVEIKILRRVRAES